MATRKSQPLVAKAVKSGAGLLFSKVVADGLGLARIALLSLFLLPIDFGVVGFSLLLSNTIHYFSEIGLETALIQKKGEVEPYLNTSWTFNIIRGSIIAAFLVIMSPRIAVLFAASGTSQEIQSLITSINVIAVFSFVRDAQNIGTVFLRKNMQFKKIIIAELSAQIISISASIIVFFFFQGYLALLAGFSSFFLFQFLFSYVIHPFRPRFSFQIAKLKDLFGFSKWIFLSGFLVFMIIQFDDYIVGVGFGVTSLGLYQLAYQIACSPTTEIANVISQVSFPSFASIQDKHELLKGGMLKNIEVITLISIPFCFLLLFFSKDVIFLFLAPEWYPIVPILQLLGIWGCTWSLGATFSSFFNAIGRPDLTTKTQAIQTLFMYTLMIPSMFFFGLLGVCTSIVIAGFITMLIRFILMKRILNFSWWEATRNIVFLLLLMALTVTFNLVLETVVFVERSVISVTVRLLIDIIFFCAGGFLFERRTSFKFLKMVMEILRAVFQKAQTQLADQTKRNKSGDQSTSAEDNIEP